MQKINLKTATLELCDHCLGRIYGLAGHGLTNDTRGKAIRVMYAMENNIDYYSPEPDRCKLCGGIFKRIDEYAEYIKKILEEYEYESFLVGSRFSEYVVELETKLQKEFSDTENSAGESISKEFNRELGKVLSYITGKEVNLSEPDIAVIVDTEYDDIILEIKPLFIYGRYLKLVRGIPQTKWPSGKYKESVEDIIAKPVMEVTDGDAHALHGMGREDIDVRMLGNGRPFVLEISHPKKRNIDLDNIQKKINDGSEGRVSVLELRPSSRSEVRKIKTAKVRKRYRAGVKVDAREEEIKNAIFSLKGKIRQRTPLRVAHRRADRVRVREVYEINLKSKENDIWIIEVLAESGTYIKELMHGDNGRTKPSLAEKLGKEVTVDFLDVIEILDYS